MPSPRDFKTMLRDDQGAILVFWGIALVAFLALVALSFDLGQKAATHSELQGFADEVALAAAGELDGKSDAISRATTAAAQILDRQTYATGAQALQGASDYTLTFFSTLPPSDTTALTSGETTDPVRAAYVRATVTPRTVPYTFWAAVDALSGTTTANPALTASAVAGFTEYACEITPLMFCIPNASFRADANVGKMILLRSGGTNAAWGPGDFGFLDPQKILVDPNGPCAGLQTAQLDRCLIAAYGSITQCFSQRGVDTEPGQKVGIENALFNVRFDIYTSVMNGDRNNAAYGPAPNVIKGIVPNNGGGGNGNQCIGSNSDPSPNTVGLPRDTCFAAGTCGRIGDGNWTAGRTNYVNLNYGGTDPHPTATTRYQYYLAEIAAHGGAASTQAILSGRAETGRPACSNRQIPDPDRRVVIAAGIDCAANDIRGAATNVPVVEFYRLFLTEPVGQDANSPPTQNLWAEIVGSAQTGSSGAGGNGGIFHDVVQLYR